VTTRAISPEDQRAMKKISYRILEFGKFNWDQVRYTPSYAGNHPLLEPTPLLWLCVFNPLLKPLLLCKCVFNPSFYANMYLNPSFYVNVYSTLY
jgi:hypothetical protein